VAHKIPQVEQPLLPAHGDFLKIGQLIGNLDAVGVEEAKLGGALGVSSGDDEVEIGWHHGCPGAPWRSAAERG
jgi:hypothetical protein